MAAVVQNLRTTTPTAIPAGLDPGQIAFNLSNKWMFVGIGGADILVKGTAVATYSTTATVLGVANVAIPAKPAAGKGYELFDLEGSGIDIGTTNPTGATKGDLFINSPAAGAPSLLIYNGSSWVPTVPSPSVYTLTTTEVTAGAGASQSLKMVSALITKFAAVTAASDLKTGDTCVVSGTPAANAVDGSYIWDGSSWVATGSGLPDATARTGTANIGTGGTKGVVYLARDIDVLATGATGSVTPDPLAVPTAAQLKLTNTAIAMLQGGTALLGTYDAASSKIASVSPEAGVAGRTGFTVGGFLSAATGVHAGDYFIVTAAGTIAGDAAGINVAVRSGDTLMYTGSAWTVLATGPVFAGLTLNSCSDVTSAVSVVTAVNQGGILVRDTSVAADGSAGAWKRVNVIDLGTF